MSKVTQLGAIGSLNGSELLYAVDGNGQDKKVTTNQIKDYVLSGTGLDPNYTIEDWDIHKTELQVITPRDTDNLDITNNPDSSTTLDFKTFNLSDYAFSAPVGQNHPGIAYVDNKVVFNGEWDKQDFNPKAIGFNNITGLRVEINPNQTGFEDHFSSDFTVIVSQLSYAEVMAMFGGQGSPPTVPLMQLQVSNSGGFTVPTRYITYLDGGPAPINKTLPNYGNFISIIPDIDGFFVDGAGQIPLKNHPGYDPSKPWNAIVMLLNNAGGDPQPDDNGEITRVKYEIPITNYLNTTSYVRHIPNIPDQDFTIQFPDFDQNKFYYLLLLPEELPEEYELSTLLFNKIAQGNMIAVTSYNPSDIQVIVLGPGGQQISQEGYSAYGAYEIRYKASDKTFYFAEIGSEEVISPIYDPSILGDILSIAIVGFDPSLSAEPSNPLTIKLPELSFNKVVNGDLPPNAKLGQLYRTTTEGKFTDRKIPIGTTISFYNDFQDFVAIPDIDLGLGLSLDYIQTKQLLINEINKLKQNQIGNYRGTFDNRYAINLPSYKKGDYVFVGANENEWRVYYAIRNSGESNMGTYYDFSILPAEAQSLTTDNIPEGSLNRYFTNERVLGLIETAAATLIPLETIVYRMNGTDLNVAGTYDVPENIENTITYDTSVGWKPSVGFLHYRVPLHQSIPKYEGFGGRLRNLIVYDFWLQQGSDQGNELRTGVVFRNSDGLSDPRYTASVMFTMSNFGELIISIFNYYGNNVGYWSMGYLANGGHMRLIIDLVAGTIEVLKNSTRILLQSIANIEGGYLVSNFQNTEFIESYFEVISKTEASLIAYPKRLSIMEKFIN